VGRDGTNEEVENNIEAIASDSHALALLKRNDALRVKIFEKLLGGNFDPENPKNTALLYNLACYYAVNKEKASLFAAARLARINGKNTEQFMADRNFKDYWDDADFQRA
jgi:hypothetical protein